jgi:hypothetical protein
MLRRILALAVSLALVTAGLLLLPTLALAPPLPTVGENIMVECATYWSNGGIYYVGGTSTIGGYSDI